MSKGLGSTFSITQQVHQCLSKQTDYGNCFVSSLAQLLLFCLCNSLYCTIMRTHLHMYHIMYHILHNIQVPGTLSWVSCLLVASSTERDQLCDLCITPGETHGIFLTSHSGLRRWSIMVLKLVGHELWWWHHTSWVLCTTLRFASQWFPHICLAF